MRRQDLRDEYKWVRDALAGQAGVRKQLPVRKKGIPLSVILGWMAVLASICLTLIMLGL